MYSGGPEFWNRKSHTVRAAPHAKARSWLRDAIPPASMPRLIEDPVLLKLQLQIKLKQKDEHQGQLCVGRNHLLRSFNKAHRGPGTLINFVEFKRGVEEFSINGSDSALQVLFNDFDRNRNGYINYLEFVHRLDPNITDDGIESAKAKLQEFEKQHPGQLCETFEIYSQNGTISPEDMRRVFHSLKLGIQEWHFRTLLEEVEKVNGGMVLYEDFLDKYACVPKTQRRPSGNYAGKKSKASDELRSATSVRSPARTSSQLPFLSNASPPQNSSVEILSDRSRPVSTKDGQFLGRSFHSLSPSRPGTNQFSLSTGRPSTQRTRQAFSPVTAGQLMTPQTTLHSAEISDNYKSSIGEPLGGSFGLSRNLHVSTPLQSGFHAPPTPERMKRMQKNKISQTTMLAASATAEQTAGIYKALMQSFLGQDPNRSGRISSQQFRSVLIQHKFDKFLSKEDLSDILSTKADVEEAGVVNYMNFLRYFKLAVNKGVSRTF